MKGAKVQTSVEKETHSSVLKWMLLVNTGHCNIVGFWHHMLSINLGAGA